MTATIMPEETVGVPFKITIYWWFHQLIYGSRSFIYN